MKNSARLFGGVVALATLLGFAAGCTGPRAKSTAPAPYMRVVQTEAGVIQLQIALRSFVPPRPTAPVICLAAVAHIGDSNYYRALQQHLDEQPLVLFEGVGRPDAGDEPAPAKGSGPHNPWMRHATEDSSLQSTMASSLGLVFQLEAIDYDRAHFRNSDLSLRQIQRLLSGPPAGAPGGGDAKPNAQFAVLMQVMDGHSLLGMIAQFGMRLVGSSPKLQAMTKLMLIEVFGQLNGDFTKMGAASPEIKELLRVLIESRNQVVLDDLKAELKKARPPTSLAVFYGAGHMGDLEKRLTRELHYRPRADRWLTAFTVNPGQAGLSTSDVNLVRSMVKWQLDALSPAEEKNGGRPRR